MSQDVGWSAVVLAAEVMDLLDALVTSIAGPTIVADIGGGETSIQWLSAAYTLAMAAGLLIGGRLGDKFGRKRMFLVGMAGFTLASALCATASSPGMLITFRVVAFALTFLLPRFARPQHAEVVAEPVQEQRG